MTISISFYFNHSCSMFIPINISFSIIDLNDSLLFTSFKIFIMDFIAPAISIDGKHSRISFFSDSYLFILFIYCIVSIFNHIMQFDKRIAISFSILSFIIFYSSQLNIWCVYFILNRFFGAPLETSETHFTMMKPNMFIV